MTLTILSYCYVGRRHAL